MSDITHRFIELYNYLRSNKIVKNDAEIARKLNVTPSAISNILAGTSQAQLKIVQGVANSFTMVNISWLLIGSGEMIKQEAPILSDEKGAKKKYNKIANSGNLVTALSLMRVRLREAEDSLSDLKQSFGNVLDLLKSLGIDSSVVEEIQDAH